MFYQSVLCSCTVFTGSHSSSNTKYYFNLLFSPLTFSPPYLICSLYHSLQLFDSQHYPSSIFVPVSPTCLAHHQTNNQSNTYSMSEKTSGFAEEDANTRDTITFSRFYAHLNIEKRGSDAVHFNTFFTLQQPTVSLMYSIATQHESTYL